MLRLAGATTLLALLLLSVPAAAQLELHGFVEGASSVRPDDSAWTLREARLQLRGEAWGERGEAQFALDFVEDGLDFEAMATLREAWFRLPLGEATNLQVGRQPINWGTGDLIFINDLFAKDWQSFLVGRSDEYLKSPVDALRLSRTTPLGEVDLIWTPSFQADRTPDGSRLRPAAGPRPELSLPGDSIDEGEWALRLSRWVGSRSISFYGYHGFWKTPSGPRDEKLVHPRLSVFGASLRGTLLGGVAWVEGGHYRSHEDLAANLPEIPDSEWRGLVGYERSPWTDGTMGMQFYQQDGRQLMTLRLRQLMRGQTLALSGFGFWSPDEGDSHLRLEAGLDLNDEATLSLGGLLFLAGDDPGPAALFHQMGNEDQVYARLRSSF